VTAPLAHAQFGVHVRCRVASGSSCCAPAQYAYDELNYRKGPEYNLWDEFPVNNSRRVENNSGITLPFDPSSRGSFFLGDDGDFADGRLSLQLRIVQTTQCFISYYEPAEKRPAFVSTMDQVTQVFTRSSSWSCVRTCGTLCCVTRYMFS
jgi:hypothetical protein